MECTEFVELDPSYEESWMNLCRCPTCKGWLPRDFPIDEPFNCKKCGTELLTFPVYDEEGERMKFTGKICPISRGSE